MFNSYTTNNNQRLDINAISGSMVKTYTKSFFQVAQMGSPIYRDLMGAEPTFTHGSSYNPKTEEVVILQTLILGDKYLMFELIFKKDFDKLFENNVDNL